MVTDPACPYPGPTAWRPAGAGWWLYFAHGRPFHPWTPGRWVHHPCREDLDRGLITITGPDQWRTLWAVDGPDKAQRIITQLSRSAALYRMSCTTRVGTSILGRSSRKSVSHESIQA